jgi:hypothetical protein
MPSKDKKTVTTYKWFKDKLDPDTKANIKKCTLQYILDDCQGNENPAPSKETLMGVIKKLAMIEPKWAKVTEANFKSNTYEAHKELENQVFNYLRGKSIEADKTRAIQARLKAVEAEAAEMEEESEEEEDPEVESQIEE